MGQSMPQHNTAKPHQFALLRLLLQHATKDAVGATKWRHSEREEERTLRRRLHRSTTVHLHSDDAVERRRRHVHDRVAVTQRRRRAAEQSRQAGQRHLRCTCSTEAPQTRAHAPQHHNHPPSPSDRGTCTRQHHDANTVNGSQPTNHRVVTLLGDRRRHAAVNRSSVRVGIAIRRRQRDATAGGGAHHGVHGGERDGCVRR